VERSSSSVKIVVSGTNMMSAIKLICKVYSVMFQGVCVHQTVLSVTAIDGLACKLINSKVQVLYSPK
jgi:hypothetical protein